MTNKSARLDHLYPKVQNKTEEEVSAGINNRYDSPGLEAGKYNMHSKSTITNQSAFHQHQSG